MSSAALVLGNGKSREQFDLRQVPVCVVTFGCNALYRDWWPDWLGCCDKNMREEIAQSRYPWPRVVWRYGYERRPHAHGWSTYGYASGPMMVRYALDMGFQMVFLLGFDMNLDNVYDGTENYDAVEPERKTTQPPEWADQLKELAAKHGNRMFEVEANKIPFIGSATWEFVTDVAWDWTDVPSCVHCSRDPVGEHPVYANKKHKLAICKECGGPFIAIGRPLHGKAE